MGMDIKKEQLSIGGIPAILWGPASQRLFIAVHGDQSHKEDDVIRIFAEVAVRKGHRVLSLDMPGHGSRTEAPRLCTPQRCAEDLGLMMAHARTLAADIGLFGCSTGAYFGMLAYGGLPIGQALLLSPVVDMARIIQNMMAVFNVSAQRLEQQKEVHTPAKTLYWNYYQYVLAHPVEWNAPTAILYGARDELCEREYVERFAKGARADMTILEECGHFFHTDSQLAFFQEWLEKHILPL